MIQVSAYTNFRALIAFLCAFAAFVVFFGADADFGRWAFERRFFGITETVTWTFPVVFSAAFTATALLLSALIRKVPRYHSRQALVDLEGRFATLALLGVVAVAGFAWTRPPNYAMSIAALGTLLFAVCEVLLWVAATAVRSRTRKIDWHAEFAATRIFTNVLLIVASLGASVALIEAALRIHNPFALRIKGDDIVLQTNYRFVIENNTPGKLEARIVHTKNAIGFRGEDPPPDLADRLSIVTVGGSTTENYYLSDDKTWTAVLGDTLRSNYPSLWINNAGLAGHSTTGHQLLLNDYIAKLEPNIVIFYIGINDLIKDGLGRGNIARLEQSVLRGANNVRPLLDRFAEVSELANLAANMMRRYQAAEAGAAPFTLNLKGEIATDSIAEPEPGEAEQVEREMEGAWAAYEQRVITLIEAARAMGARPVLMTQPLLAGEGLDPDRGLRRDNLAQTLMNRTVSSLTYWHVLERYNDVLRELATETGVPVIDVAHRLPKRSDYFTDIMHYSLAGADAVGKIVARDLCPWIAETMGGYTPDEPCPAE